MNSIKPKTRNVAIDIMKFAAVFVVLNSHMELCYGKYSYLATGGAIGDALFFFCSGFMLFKGKDQRIDNYLKKRISRIYPTVIIVALVIGAVFNIKKDLISILLSGGGWFVNCIMIYYVLLWVVKRFFINKLRFVWSISSILVIISYYSIFNYTDGILIYGDSYYKWIFFFLFMLQGAVIGRKCPIMKCNVWSIIKLICCIGIWYSFFLISKLSNTIVYIQIFSIIPLLGVTYYTYEICCARIWERAYSNPFLGQVIFIISSLCLECYLIQFYFISDSFNSYFPLNIPVTAIVILGVSYIIKFLSNLFIQTFQKDNYDWGKMLIYKRS